MGDNFLKNDFTLFAAGNGVSKNSIEKYFNYINPTILEERQLNVTQMDVFSRLMADRIIFSLVCLWRGFFTSEALLTAMWLTY